MSNDIKLTIELPTGKFLEKNVPSVVLPAVRAPIEILPDHAPLVLVLDYGVVQITGNGNKDKYFIYSGMAEIADNHCKVMTQEVVAAEDINVNKALELAEQATDENERLFYQMIADSLRGMRRRYLRTLKMFSKMVKRLRHK